MYLRMAWRNAWRNPRRTAVIMTAVVIGVWSMIFLGAFMRGMLDNMLQNGKSVLTGDIQIHQKLYRQDPSVENSIEDMGKVIPVLENILPENARFASRIRVSAVVSNARHSFGVIFAGVDFKREAGVSFIGKKPYKGAILKQQDNRGILAGKALVDKLGTDIGKKLIVTTRDTNGEIVSRAFRIRGVFRAQMASVEERFVFVSTGAARQMVKMERGTSEISIVLPAGSSLEQTADTLRRNLDTGVLAVDTWKDLLPMLRAYTDIFNGFMNIWYVVVFIAMGFGIVNTTLMAVFERIREFGLLRALGLKPLRIVHSIVTESALILAGGILAGNLLGILSVFLVRGTGLDLTLLGIGKGAEFFGMSSVVYPALALRDIVSANMTVFFLGLLVSIYPAVRAACITPVEAMRD